MPATVSSSGFFFNDTTTTETYTLSLHDALPISARTPEKPASPNRPQLYAIGAALGLALGLGLTVLLEYLDSSLKTEDDVVRSEEHTSELQSHSDLVCRLLLEKKKKKTSRVGSTA